MQKQYDATYVNVCVYVRVCIEREVCGKIVNKILMVAGFENICFYPFIFL